MTGILRSNRTESSTVEAASDPLSSCVSFLPGPVGLSTEVQRAFSGPPYSHRSDRFAAQLDACRRDLRELTGAKRVAILVGTGTLANDVVAAQILGLGGRGLVLSNGEFGDRLADHARRTGLAFDAIRLPWGAVFPDDRTISTIAQRRHGWVWGCHCETSTGVLNDVAALHAACAENGAELVLDCISSVGAVPVDLSEVLLASGVSGKALASYAGLALVFHREAVGPDPSLPRYLDLGAYAETSGVPYTSSSNLMDALGQALAQRMTEGGEAVHDPRSGPSRRPDPAGAIRARLRLLGCTLWATDAHASPAVVSFRPPDGVDSMALGESLDRMGVHLSYRSRYLVAHNTLQACLMGTQRNGAVDVLLDALGEALK